MPWWQGGRSHEAERVVDISTMRLGNVMTELTRWISGGASWIDSTSPVGS
jgi:hypothetical protein